MFVVILTYTQPLEVMDKLRPAHLEFLDTYYAKGVFLASGCQNPPTGGVILAKGIDRDELDAIMREDVFYAEKAATFEIVEFDPIKFAPGVKELITA
jgi:uncharacterized protein YciI